MTITKIALRDRLTMIAAQARLISLAAENGTLGDGDLTGVVNLADRIERQLIEIADEVHHGEPDDEDETRAANVSRNDADAKGTQSPIEGLLKDIGNRLRGSRPRV